MKRGSKALIKYWNDVGYISRKWKFTISKTRSEIKGMSKIERTALRKSLIKHRKKKIPPSPPGRKFKTTRAYLEDINLTGSDPANIPEDLVQWIDSMLDNVKKEIEGKIYYHFRQTVDHPVKDILPKEKPMFEVDKFTHTQMLFIVIYTYLVMFDIWQIPMDSKIELGIEPL